MRILVAGSLHHLPQDDIARALPFFEKVCRQIGAQIAVRGHTLIVGTDNKNCADLYFAEGAANSGADVQMVVIRANTGKRAHPAFDGWDNRVANLERQPTEASTWFDTRSDQVRNADAIILIGGVSGTWNVFEQALAFGRPVVPLGYVGGTAAALFSETLVKEAIPASAANLFRDRNAWKRSESPQMVVQKTEELFRKQSALVKLTYYARALPSYGTRLVKKLLQSLKWLFLAVAGAVVGILVNDNWYRINELF